MPATQTPPRRKWHLTRWAIVVIACIFAWSGWEAYAFRSAMAKARALGWNVIYLAPFDSIRADWRAAFEKGTWISPVQIDEIQSSEEFEQNMATIRRLNPESLEFIKTPNLPAPALFNSLPALESIWLDQMELNQRTFDTLAQIKGLRRLHLANYKGELPQNAFEHFKSLDVLKLYSCQDITTLDPLKNLNNLQTFYASNCDRLTNVSALAYLTNLRSVMFKRCWSIKQDAIAPLQAALPKTHVETFGFKD